MAREIEVVFVPRRLTVPVPRIELVGDNFLLILPDSLADFGVEAYVAVQVHSPLGPRCRYVVCSFGVPQIDMPLEDLAIWVNFRDQIMQIVMIRDVFAFVAQEGLSRLRR